MVGCLAVRSALGLAAAVLGLGCAFASGRSATDLPAAAPFLVVLGVAQDGGVPQAGTREHPGWEDPTARRRVACLGLVDPLTSQRWLFEATPDFPEQLHALDGMAPRAARPGLDGIFLTHAHIGHYAGLMWLGLESMGAREVPVYAMPRMREYLSTNGPWSQLVRLRNIVLQPLKANQPVTLNQRLRVVPLPVPHRQEYSEVVGYRIDGPQHSVLFIPDIDSWEQLDAAGVRIEQLLSDVDFAYLDATFYDGDEIPGVDMSAFPHPFITHTMARLADLPAPERAKVRFIHLNHTNPALWPDREAHRSILSRGFRLAAPMERVDL